MSRVWLRSPSEGTDQPTDQPVVRAQDKAPRATTGQPARASGVVPGCPTCNPDGKPGGGSKTCTTCGGTGTG